MTERRKSDKPPSGSDLYEKARLLLAYGGSAEELEEAVETVRQALAGGTVVALAGISVQATTHAAEANNTPEDSSQSAA